MHVSTPEMSKQQKFLADFKKDVDLPITNHAEANQWLSHVKDILKKSVPAHPKTPLAKKALDLQERLKWPVLDKTNIYAMKSLNQEMQAALKEKISQLSSTLAIQSMLSCIIPPYQIESFLEAIRMTYRRDIVEGASPKKALENALAYAIGRSLIENTDLENEEVLQRYKCIIKGDVVDSQPAYLRVDSQDQPREVYHETDIMHYLGSDPRDPITRERKTIRDIRKDPKQQERVRSLISSLKYPQLGPFDVSSLQGPIPLSSLASASMLFAARVGYSLAKEIYEETRKEQDYNAAALQAGKVQSFAIGVLEPFLREASDEDLSFLPWVPKVPRERIYTDAQRWWSYSLDSSSQDIAHSSENRWKVRVQFMQAFLRYHTKEGVSLERIDDLQEKLRRQLLEYEESFQEINRCGLTEARKKELQEQILEQILQEEAFNASSSSGSKKRSLTDPEGHSVKKVKKDPSDIDVQIQMVQEFLI